MTSASGVRAGRTFIEIGADDSAFTAALKRAHNRMASFGQAARQIGTGLAMGGAALGLPMVLATKQAAGFQDALLELKGSVSDISPKDLERVHDAALRMSREMGVAPTEIAQSMTLLVKAGMSVEDALNGAGKAAVEFARVSGVSAQEAATFMKVSMNVFGVSASEAVDTLSAAADASETDIRHMVEAFGLVGSAGKLFNQSIFGLSQGMAALARYGIQGEEAGTGLKVLFARLVSPTKEARDALGKFGLTVENFRDQDGNLLPLVQIVDILSKSMKGVDKVARDNALMNVFGDRGIKVIGAFVDLGVNGFNKIADEMEKQRSVTEKFNIMMSQLSGTITRLWSAVERLSIAFGEQLSTALSVVGTVLVGTIDMLAWLLTNVPGLAVVVAGLTAVAFGLGIALLGVSAAVKAVNFGIASYVKYAPAVVAWMAGMATAAGGLATSLWNVAAAMTAVLARIPILGWIALAVGVGVGAWAAWDLSKASKAGDKKKAKPKRDEFRDPMVDGAGPAAAATGKRGATLATFVSQIAAQLGIGPSLEPAQETAENTARMADGIDQLVRNDNARMPAVAGLQRGMASVAPTAGGVTANADRDLVSSNERAAMASEQQVSLLRRIEEHLRGGGAVAFA